MVTFLNVASFVLVAMLFKHPFIYRLPASSPLNQIQKANNSNNILSSNSMSFHTSLSAFYARERSVPPSLDVPQSIFLNAAVTEPREPCITKVFLQYKV